MSTERKGWCMNRRAFLSLSGAVVATATLGSLFPQSKLSAQAASTPVQLARYPRRQVGTVRGLDVDQPQAISYPYAGDPYSQALLIKLGVPAGGGVGPGQDIVAFSTICTHAGGPLQNTYRAEHKVMGACPLHLTTFDLTRHGMVVAGHATEGLPQVLLEVEGDDIYATGVLGLMFGSFNNLVHIPAKS